MKNQETTLKNHGNQPKTMKNHENTLKNHGKQPKNMNNRETTLKNHGNQGGGRALQEKRKNVTHAGSQMTW